MAGYLNKVILIGRVGQDPQGSKTKEQNISLATFSLATNKEWKDVNGEKQKKVTWHKIVAWRKKGELVLNYIKKGSSIMVEGELSYRKYVDKEGNNRETCEIEAKDIIFLDSKSSTSVPSSLPSPPAELDIPDDTAVF